MTWWDSANTRATSCTRYCGLTPATWTWIAYKFQPRIPKQARFQQIARIYHSAYHRLPRRKIHAKNNGRYLGKPGTKWKDWRSCLPKYAWRTILTRRGIKNGQPCFYVRQEDKSPRPCRELRQLSASTHARQAAAHAPCPPWNMPTGRGETIKIASARIVRTYTAGGTKYTRLTHVRLGCSEDTE